MSATLRLTAEVTADKAIDLEDLIDGLTGTLKNAKWSQDLVMEDGTVIPADKRVQGLLLAGDEMAAYFEKVVCKVITNKEINIAEGEEGKELISKWRREVEAY